MSEDTLLLSNNINFTPEIEKDEQPVLRYYLRASANIQIGKQVLYKGEYFKTPTGRIKTFQKIERAIDFKKHLIGHDKEFPLQIISTLTKE